MKFLFNPKRKKYIFLLLVVFKLWHLFPFSDVNWIQWKKTTAHTTHFGCVFIWHAFWLPQTIHTERRANTSASFMEMHGMRSKNEKEAKKKCNECTRWILVLYAYHTASISVLSLNLLNAKYQAKQYQNDGNNTNYHKYCSGHFLQLFFFCG